jgi:hypothetical protein
VLAAGAVIVTEHVVAEEMLHAHDVGALPELHVALSVALVPAFTGSGDCTTLQFEGAVVTPTI